MALSTSSFLAAHLSNTAFSHMYTAAYFPGKTSSMSLYQKARQALSPDRITLIKSLMTCCCKGPSSNNGYLGETDELFSTCLELVSASSTPSFLRNDVLIMHLSSKSNAMIIVDLVPKFGSGAPQVQNQSIN